MKQQSKDVITEFMEQGLNTELYYKNKDWGETYSIVPTSAISGEGIPEMLLLLIQWAQKTMVKELTYISEVQNLEHVVAGTTLYAVGPHDDVEEIKESVMDDAVSRIDKSGEGVYVQASTLGSLEALLALLKTPAIGTPICIPQKDFIDIGRISSIEDCHKRLDYAKKGQKVAIQIKGSNAEEQQKMFGRHFDMEDVLVSHISRTSVDALKAYYQDELSEEEWKLVVQMESLFTIQ
ncbi:hypothetical protein L1987_84173 [Smallanthus sonchifolius]|uniref:Uncharacterized protein n=1 Tax=Smallanthus sonchifolius TaxID=185202 RepID=A0ACB8YF46_9ASTR|nr:hypothetical protein L1987_84173 [Smallanthus sonchifolius]